MSPIKLLLSLCITIIFYFQYGYDYFAIWFFKRNITVPITKTKHQYKNLGNTETKDKMQIICKPNYKHC